MSEEIDIMAFLKDALPELDLDSLSPEAGSSEEMQIRLDAMEKSIAGLTDALKETVVLYEEARQEAKVLRASHDSAKAAAGDVTKKFAIDLMSMFSVDYNALVMNMAETGVIDLEKIAEVVKTHMEKTSEIAKFQKKVAELVKETCDIDYDDLEVDHETLGEYIDYDDLSQHICYSTISDYLSFDPTDYWDSSDLAYNFDASDIAEYIDTEDVAGYVEVDLDEIAAKISAQDVAQNIDLDEVALFVSQNIDLDELAQKVKDLRGDE